MSHIDTSVVYFLMGTFLAASTLVAFRYANDTPCDVATFESSANAYRVGEMVQFKDRTDGAQQWEWDFGDGSEISNQKNPLHIYTEKGNYDVRLTVNNSCVKMETLAIQAKTILLDSTKFPVFDLPKTIRVGETLTVHDKTARATSWEWRFGETASANAISRTAEYSYETPGLKTVSLIVNGDITYIGKKKIEVLPLPETKERIAKIAAEERDKRLDLRKAPTGAAVADEDIKTELAEKPEARKPSTVPFISAGNFENKIKMIASGKLSPQAFSQYFCEDVNPLVVINGRNTTFLVFCEKIKDKKIKISSLELLRNTGSNCVTTFTLEYKKSGLF